MSTQFQALGQLLASAGTGPPHAERVVRFAVQAVPHSDFAGLTLVRSGRRPMTIAATGEPVRHADTLQYEVGEGPCLEAIDGRDVTVAADLRVSRRWPEFGRRRVAETSIRSIVSVRLLLSGSDRAALNLYAARPTVFEDRDIGVAAMFAPFVALAVQSELQSQHIEQLETALQSSRQIGTAVGILMARHLVTSDDAFAQLVRASEHLNRKVRDIAAEVTTTGQLPELAEKGPGVTAPPPGVGATSSN